MDNVEAINVVWMALSDYAENCVSDDKDALNEIEKAWKLVINQLQGANK